MKITLQAAFNELLNAVVKLNGIVQNTEILVYVYLKDVSVNIKNNDLNDDGRWYW